jgi:hypothetical protein
MFSKFNNDINELAEKYGGKDKFVTKGHKKRIRV